jgi:hypothetical protein
LLSAEDVGLAVQLQPEEIPDAAACRKVAETWLPKIAADPDMAVDTRVVVPIYNDFDSARSHVWATVGVRIARLEARYLYYYPPSVRPKTGGEWTKVEGYKLQPAEYLIAVDEFVAGERPTLTPLSREEFRSICDSAKTKEEIAAKLGEK